MQGLERFRKAVFIDKTGFAVEIDQNFDVGFTVDKSDKRDPDTAAITIFNLTKNIRQILGSSAETVELYAGRYFPPPLIFKGEITDADSHRSDSFADWVTEIEAEDTKSKLRTLIVARTYAAGSSLQQAIRDLAVAVDIQPDLQFVDMALPTQMSFLGPPRDSIKKLCDRFGFRYQVIDGRLLVRLADVPVSLTEVPIVSAQTGLIGVPTVSRENKIVRVNFSCMLTPELLPGGLCQLVTGAMEGSRKAPLKTGANYWLTRVTHQADPEPEGQFITSVECKEVA